MNKSVDTIRIARQKDLIARGWTVGRARRMAAESLADGRGFTQQAHDALAARISAATHPEIAGGIAWGRL